MIIGLNYTNAKTIDDLNDQMCRVIKEISFLTTGNIDAENIRANSITANLIQAGTITTTEIADGSITNNKISNAAIDNTKIIDSTIQGIKLQAGTLTDTQIANLAISGSKIANTTITGNKIVTGTITADKLSVSQLSAITADLGAVTAGTINSVIITGGTLRTSSSGPRIQITNDSFNVYDNSGSRLSINAFTSTTTSGASIDFQTAGSTVSSLYTSGSDFKLETTSMNIRIVPGGTGSLYIPFTNTLNSSGGLSLTSTFSPISHTQAWSTITGTPTTLSGYGITSVSWSVVTGTPTTLSGYGITNGATKSSATSGPSATTTGGAHNHGLNNTHEVYMRNPTTLGTYWASWNDYGGFTVPTTTHTHTQN